eukprot:CAMPEP_0171369318 /NCGR_PEP_ID=MMETSP0879-20121228/7292_1 /TAXON_ID=67004 /ORGANISM="Thalassiosira weissflogii, Strain CCMP1336" /LENGTH=765 /DNA_ID=CAMNT_0011877617 /DNA_START=1 /DNA_END=2298 /DNA_ORIENTATION=-
MFRRCRQRNDRSKPETSNNIIPCDNAVDSHSIPNSLHGKAIDAISLSVANDVRNHSKTTFNRPANGESTTSENPIPSSNITPSEYCNPSSNNSNPRENDNTAIEEYEHRIEELGQMMLEQGRCLDELTAQSGRLSSENSLLRERLSAGMESILTHVIADRSEGKSENQASGRESSLTGRKPLKNIMSFHNQSKSSTGSSRVFKNDKDDSNAIKKYKDEVDLLTQQSELLAKELASANEQIAERDERIVSLGNDLSACMKKARKLIIENQGQKKSTLDMKSEIETLKASIKNSNAQRSELSSRADRLLSERREIEQEVETLKTHLTRSSTKIEEMQAELSSIQSNVEYLTEQNDELQQAEYSSKRSAKAQTDTITSLHESIRKAKLQTEQLESSLKENKDRLEESILFRHKLQSKCDSLEAEIESTVKHHKEIITSWTKDHEKIIFAITEQYTAKIRTQEKVIEKLESSNAFLENEQSRCQRDRLSLEIRCSALEKTLHARDKEQKKHYDDVMARAEAAEEELVASRMVAKDCKRNNEMLENKLTTLKDRIKMAESLHEKNEKELREEILTAKQENEKLSTLITSLKEVSEKTIKEYASNKRNMQSTLEKELKEAGLECQALRASKANQQRKLHEIQDMMEKQKSIDEELIHQMKIEGTEIRAGLERTISKEREVSQRLMTKIQGLNHVVQTLTYENLEFTKRSRKHQEEVHQLRSTVANGELILSNLGRQMSKCLEEQDQRIRKESELKMELERTRLELDQYKSK